MKNDGMTDVVISSRVRFARNIADYPFKSKLDKTSANEIIEKVKAALGDGYEFIDLTGEDEVLANSLVEDHSISREFAVETLPHALLCSQDGVIRIMICEEDHIRLQAICRGMDLDKAFERASEVEEELSEKLNIAYDEKLGYLTHCPTNLGIAMRASAMLFLPALTGKNMIKSLISVLSKLGVTIRGIYGEGSDALGCLYQVSNSETLGVSEENVISKLNGVITKIVELERKERDELYKAQSDYISNKVLRSLGVLKYAYMLDTSEFMRCYSDVRLGISLGLIEEPDYDKIDGIFTQVMPNNLMKSAGKKLDEHERDIARAKLVKELLS